MKILKTEVKSCGSCPKWKTCKPSKKLTGQQRFFFLCGVGMPKYLPDCPLKDEEK